MGEPTCLMQVQQQQQQPFSYSTGLSNNEQNEGNPIHALGQSVSFGRFMSESLAWEKWSSFSHNRYVEEAERYSRPGSVAQKKAFFEAHYKNLAAKKAAEAAAAAAVALLEQENSAASSQYECDSVGVGTATADSETAMASKLEAVVVETKTSIENEQQRPVVDSDAKVVDNGDESVLTVKDTELNETDSERVEKSNSKRDQEQVSLQKITSKKKKTALPCSSSSSKSSSTTKPAVPLKPLTKSAVVNATPMSKKHVLESADKKRATPKSFHMAVNFSPIREISRLKSTVIRKIDNSRFGSNSSSKPSKDYPIPLKTPIKVSKSGTRQQPLETPCSAKRRITTPVNPSASGSKPTGPKWRLLATDCSKFLSACRNKSRSPLSSTPFSFRTDERAAKRKEKLEEKFNAKEVVEAEPKTKVKDKPEAETGKLRPGFCFKARPLPDFYKQRRAQNEETQKVTVTHSQSPKPRNNKATPSKIEIRSSQTPNRPIVKSNVSKHFQGKNPRSSACSLISRPKRTTTITHENTSPNIQYR